MNCDCIKRINEKLADQNFALDVSFINLMTSFDETLSISTHWKDSSKKIRGKKPSTILITFCPFCTKRVNKPELDDTKQEETMGQVAEEVNIPNPRYVERGKTVPQDIQAPKAEELVKSDEVLLLQTQKHKNRTNVNARRCRLHRCESWSLSL